MLNFEIVSNRTKHSKPKTKGKIIIRNSKFYLLTIKDSLIRVKNDLIYNSPKKQFVYSDNKHYKSIVQKNVVINNKTDKQLKIINEHWKPYYEGQTVLNYKIINNKAIIIKTDDNFKTNNKS